MEKFCQYVFKVKKSKIILIFGESWNVIAKKEGEGGIINLRNLNKEDIMKKWIKAMVFSLAIIFTLSVPAFADVAEGDVILSLGQDLTKEQREKLLDSFGATEDDTIVEVTNAEEYEYLGDFVPAGKIGKKAISSAKITYGKKGDGINVETSERIGYITADMYKQALHTAGVEDADIFVDAPMNVSGTAALTGIMKAYEISSGDKLGEEVKKAANEELVVTSTLGEEIGADEAEKLINDIKVAISEKSPKTTEEVRDIIVNISNQYNINLTDSQRDQLTSFFDKLRGMDIDWNALGSKAKDMAGQAKEYLGSEEGQGLLMSIKEGFSSFIDWIASLFKSE